MSKQFTPCPACGALGEVNCTCQFCGTTIILKEGTIATDSRVVKQRTVTPQQYAEKISFYHNVEPVGKLKIVSIGKEYGVVNLNGDLIYPLGDNEIELGDGDTIKLGYYYTETVLEASTKWDNIMKKWEHEEAIKTEFFRIKKYFNLETGIYADKFGFIKDKEDPNKLYRVNVNKNWEPMHTYINLEGEEHSFEYAESIEIEGFYSRNIYLLHKGDEHSLWITYNEIYDKDSSIIKYRTLLDAINNKPDASIFVLNGIHKEYRIENNEENTQIIVKTLDNIEVTLTLLKGDDGHKFHCSIDEIYKEWSNKRITQTKKKHDNELKGILKNIALDPNLLKQINAYIKEIKNNPNLNEFIEIHFYNDCLFMIENNTVNTDWLPNKNGVSLTTASCLMTEKQWDILQESSLYKFFNQYENYENINIDFSLDARALCATIQYLAKIYSCPITDITIKQFEYITPEEEDNLSSESIALLVALGSILMLIAVFFFFFGFEYPEMFGVAGVCGITGAFLLFKYNH